MVNWLSKHIPTMAFVFTGVIYALNPSNVTVQGLCIGMAIMLADAAIFLSLKVLNRPKYDDSVNLKIAELTKQVDSLKTALNMKQFGR